ncbi:MAG: RNA polymerase sigma factor [bacterium]
MGMINESVEEIIERIYINHLGIFYNIAMNNFKFNRETTEDMIQKAFVKTLETKDRIRIKTEAGIRSYILIVFQNIIIDFIRKNKNIIIITDDSLKANSKNDIPKNKKVADNAPSPLEIILIGESKRFLKKACKELPSRRRKILKLIYFKNQSWNEIAEKLFITRATFYREKERALKQLKKIYKKFMGDLTA